MLDQWRALSARIRGLVEAADLEIRYRSAHPSDSGSWEYLRGQCEGVLTAAETFERTCENDLPVSASIAMKRVPDWKLKLASGNMRDMKIQSTVSVIVELRAFEAEMTFLLSGSQRRLRSITERAFQHLQRLIIVDTDVRKKWQEAFQAGEIQCERLGATHLLWHGVFAYKIHADRARTDLVFNDQLTETGQGYAEALVLTEWKKAKDQTQAEQRSSEAIRQAESYVAGPLTATELRDFRYIVVVTWTQINLPADDRRGNATYRHINIAVCPRLPSVDAKKSRPLPRAFGQISNSL